jgi:hypothetical protein
VLRWEYDDTVSLLYEPMGEMLSLRDTVECISEKLESIYLFTRARPDLECISEHMKHPGFEVCSRPLELEIHECGDECFELILFSYGEFETLLLVFVCFSDTIDT